eukprot:g28596.t1
MTAVKGRAVTFYYTFPLFLKIPAANVYWWKLGDNTMLGTDLNGKKEFVAKKGSGSFQLLSVSVKDAGMCFCEMSIQNKLIGNGTGSLPIVH